MSDAKTEQEPSIEEILESIRQIISDDGDATTSAKASTEGAQPPEPVAASDLDLSQSAPEAAEEDDDDDILDLTQKVVPSSTTVIDMQDSPMDAPQQEHENEDQEPPVVASASSGEEAAPGRDDAVGSLLSPDATDLSAHALAKLLSGNIAVERELPGRVGNVTLEDMTRELLRPLLKAWLDENLPALIEKQVAREIEKIARLAMKP